MADPVWEAVHVALASSVMHHQQFTGQQRISQQGSVSKQELLLEDRT
jgi:hypothetical protein